MEDNFGRSQGTKSVKGGTGELKKCCQPDSMVGHLDIIVGLRRQTDPTRVGLHRDAVGRLCSLRLLLLKVGGQASQCGPQDAVDQWFCQLCNNAGSSEHELGRRHSLFLSPSRTMAASLLPPSNFCINSSFGQIYFRVVSGFLKMLFQLRQFDTAHLPRVKQQRDGDQSLYT